VPQFLFASKFQSQFTELAELEVKVNQLIATQSQPLLLKHVEGLALLALAG
jgi:hypothetical protein